MAAIEDPFPDHDHDHRRCVDEALAAAAALCQSRGVRLTALRRQVLALIWRRHRPVGAYDLLDQLQSERETAARPATVYRALAFLVEHGLVHRIESRNGYVGCSLPGIAHPGHFLICKACGQAAEIDDDALTRAIRGRASAAGFDIHEHALEIRGLCAGCRKDGGGQGLIST